MSNSNNITIEKTRDGSTTLYSSLFEQPYHSRGGAVGESRQVFFESSGILKKLKNHEDIHLQEIGFGSGLNLVLLIDYLQKSGSESNIVFHSVEAYPITSEKASYITFGESLDRKNYTQILGKIFSSLSAGENSIDIHPQIELNLFVGQFDELPTPSEELVHYIFHDPFSPDSNPAGWTVELFEHLNKISTDQAVLTTYSAASSARAAMAVAGWNVARAPGALGKREMTIASKHPDRLSHLKRVNEERLIERFNQGDFQQ